MEAIITEDELTNLIQENRKEMYYFAMSMLNNPTEAQDTVGQAVLKAFERRYQLRKRESAKAWIMQIVANEAKKILRHRKRTVPLEEEMLEKAGERKDSYDDIWNYILALPLPFRSVIVLYYFEQFSVEEIGKILGISTGTVKSRLSRSREKLAYMMQEEGYFYE